MISRRQCNSSVLLVSREVACALRRCKSDPNSPVCIDGFSCTTAHSWDLKFAPLVSREAALSWSSRSIVAGQLRLDCGGCCKSCLSCHVHSFLLSAVPSLIAKGCCHTQQKAALHRSALLVNRKAALASLALSTVANRLSCGMRVSACRDSLSCLLGRFALSCIVTHCSWLMSHSAEGSVTALHCCSAERLLSSLISAVHCGKINCLVDYRKQCKSSLFCLVCSAVVANAPLIIAHS